jgi:hypothetical protein
MMTTEPGDQHRERTLGPQGRFKVDPKGSTLELQGVRAALIANEMASIHVEVVDTDARSKIATIEETKPLRTFAHKHAKGVLLVLFVLLMAVVVTYVGASCFGPPPACLTRRSRVSCSWASSA